MAKKPYEKPAVVHTEKVTTRATSCNKGNDACDTGGAPIQS